MDIYQIPGDTGGRWRFDKFIEYHIRGIDDTNAPLRYLLDKKEATVGERIWAVLLYSASYCLGTAMFAYDKLDYRTLTLPELEDFWSKYKSSLVFQSDRRYVKNMNWFVPIVSDFIRRTERNPEAYFKNLLSGTPKEVHTKMYKEVASWRYYGRFSIILFLRVLVKAIDIKIDFDEGYNWKQGSTTTAGALLLGYKDERIKPFLEDGKVPPKMQEYLDRRLAQIGDYLRENYPEREVSSLYITSDLCSYFKLFKQTRYIGYYVDRAQGELIQMQKALPKERVWDDIYEARKKTVKNKYLGELNGWSGVRQGRFARFAESGILDY